MLYLGRATRTKETLPDFLKWRRVTRHPLVFHGLTGSQRTPEFGASHKGYILRVRDSSYFGLFSTLRVVWLCLCPKGSFGKILKHGNAALF